jgi:hypothetical protein
LRKYYACRSPAGDCASTCACGAAPRYGRVRQRRGGLGLRGNLSIIARSHRALITAAAGRFTLPARDKIADCLRPQHRIFTMGGDVLFDCDLRAAAAASTEPSGDLIRVV